MHSLTRNTHVVHHPGAVVDSECDVADTEWTADQVERALWSATLASKQTVQGTKRKR